MHSNKTGNMNLQQDHAEASTRCSAAAGAAASAPAAGFFTAFIMPYVISPSAGRFGGSGQADRVSARPAAAGLPSPIHPAPLGCACLKAQRNVEAPGPGSAAADPPAKARCMRSRVTISRTVLYLQLGQWAPSVAGAPNCVIAGARLQVCDWSCWQPSNGEGGQLSQYEMHPRPAVLRLSAHSGARDYSC